MANILEANVRSHVHGNTSIKRYVRVTEMTEYMKEKYEKLYSEFEKDGLYSMDAYTKLLAIAASAFYKLPKIELIHKERLDDYMKHLYKVPGTNKQVNKKFVRIGEGSIIYGIGHHRFIEMARAAGATYKINESTGGTVLINLEMFDEYMEQFRQKAIPMKHPLFKAEKEGE